MPWLIGGGLLLFLLAPKIAAGLSWLGGVLFTGLMWAAGIGAGLAALAIICNYVILPLIERWLDNREAERLRQANRPRPRPGPGLPRPAFAPPRPTPAAIPQTPPTGNGQAAPAGSNGRRQPRPAGTSEALECAECKVQS
jgi:hypothetical protein